MRRIAAVIVVVALAQPGQAKFGIGMTGAVKKKVDKLDQKVRQQKQQAQPAVSVATITVVGQLNGTLTLSNRGEPAGAKTLNAPVSVFSNGAKLFAADTNNHRILIYNAIPSSDNASADVVVGQPNMTVALANQGGGGQAMTLSSPRASFPSGSRLFIADRGNNRVLIYTTIPTVNNALANVVVGQPDMTSTLCNQGIGTAANTLCTVQCSVSDGAKLFVCDTNRVLIFNSIPSANNASANVVVGQPDMSSWCSNQDCFNGTAAAANTLRDARGAFSDGTRLFVADTGNNRVLIFDPIPTANGVAASVVVGQPDMTSTLGNQGGGAAANTLRSPYAVASYGGRLFIADSGNSRILIFNAIPTSNNASASLVVGQPDMAQRLPNQGGGAAATITTINEPYGVFSDGSNLYIADTSNHRVLIYNPSP